MLADHDPDYVVIGETRSYGFASITTAIRLVEGGARFLVANPDEKGPGAEGSRPATGAVTALSERVTGRPPYYVGKPNPLMLRSALRALGTHAAHTVVLGDRMDTDVRSGMEAGTHTVLVLSGPSDENTAAQCPHQPDRVINSVTDLTEHVADPFRT
ncbi:HAD superfamily hydrolase (TIGR01450 family) [Saccharopolyspora lacisalsi]|uniref:HAD superfamily hydrolase (TIGR01450 family) n=1 Tax=Halosaccharopolyspora lacisalsi TaxID=1000566 RepID=A0A839DSS5_9PSEU|nr:HAD superfamily hydrolase (TIGR01450 family) [Halosaccharopolyspora lacisalsi]